MFKSQLTAAVLALVCSISFAQDKKAEEQEGYIYQPKIEIKKIPNEQIKIVPAPESLGEGIGIGCNTLRGRGLGAVIIQGHIIYFVIDCPEQIMKDI